MTLTTSLTDDQRSAALLQAVGFDRLNPAQRELALGIANRYHLDPMLKHLVMIQGRPYITRDGLLHVAHSSGQLDGIETTDPRLDEDGAFWRSTCSVYRKDMSRPFTYTGRYPAKGGGNQQYAPEMAVKVGEVMALRRAFDIAAPTAEERWDLDQDATSVPPPEPEPKSLADRVAKRAKTVAPVEGPVVDEHDATNDVEVEPVADATAGVDQPEITETPEPVAEVPTGVPGRFDGVPVVEVPDEPDPTPTSGSSEPVSPLRDPDDDGPTLEEFAEILKDVDKTTVKRVAKSLFPNASKFADLKPGELGLIIDTIAAEESETTEYETPTVENGGIALCGDVSPLSGNTCTLDAGHSGAIHRAGLKESW